MSQSNEPAFPGPRMNAEMAMGLTKREYFAGLAMSGFLLAASRPEEADKIRTDAEARNQSTGRYLATQAVYMADTLISELAKEPQQ